MAATQAVVVINALKLELLSELPFHGHFGRKIKIGFSYSVSFTVEPRSAHKEEN